MNNYDQSSAGVSIDLTVRYDNEQSQWNFNDTFTNIVGDTWWFKSWEGIPAPTCFDDLFTIKVSELQVSLSILSEQHCYNNDLTEEDFDKYEAWDEVLGNYSFPSDLSDFVDMLDNYDIEHTKLFELTTSSGYSQGDYVEVFIPNNIRDIYGIPNDIALVDNLQEDIDHLLWDSPLSVRITINNEEYYSDKFDGQYIEFNKDIFINEVLTAFDGEVDMDILKSELLDLVPDEPSWD